MRRQICDIFTDADLKAPGTMRIAAITMSYNESVYLPIWCRYYGNQLGAESLYIIDHGSDDKSPDLIPAGANVITIPRREFFDEGARTRFVNGLQRSLFEYYDAIIYGDTDEIIIPDPAKYANIRHFLVSAAPVTVPIGLHVFQALGRDPDIDLSRPILGQRRFCQFSTAMCKPVIARTPIEWSAGFHSGTVEPHCAEDIFLFHLKSIDYKQSLDRLARTRSMSWSQSDIQFGVSHHHRAEDEAHLHSFFRCPTADLSAAENLDFEFAENVARVRSSITVDHGFYNISHFNGRMAAIPDRFLQRV